MIDGNRGENLNIEPIFCAEPRRHIIHGIGIFVVAHLNEIDAPVPLQLVKASDRPGMAEAFEATLLETGRPVVLTGQKASKSFARRIAIGWDGSGACARALLAAMPYLARAEAIELLSIRKPNTECESCDEAREYLSLHGLSCEERMFDAGSRSIGEVLLEAASQGGTDLLVLGGYGHKSLLQMFSGGVTKHVVAHAELPLFLVH